MVYIQFSIHFSLFLIKNQKFVDNLDWIYPTPIPAQRFIALSELQYFSVDGFSLGELSAPDSTAEIHNKVDIVPFYLVSLLQRKCI